MQRVHVGLFMLRSLKVIATRHALANDAPDRLTLRA